MRDRYIYKVMTSDQWQGFRESGQFMGSPVDLADGFVHMSRASQLKATLDKWYSDQGHVVLLQIDSAEIEADLKYEISRGGAEFPHLFAPLPLTAVGKTWDVSPKAGQYNLPEDLKAN